MQNAETIIQSLGEVSKFVEDFGELLVRGTSAQSADILQCGESYVRDGFYTNKTNTADSPLCLATAYAGQATQMFAPSILLKIIEFPDLARFLSDTTSSGESLWKKPLRNAAIALMFLDGADVTLPKLEAHFQASASPWKDWFSDKQILRQVLRSLTSDTAVQDIDTHWGEGAAMTMGQDIVRKLRGQEPAMLVDLSPDSAVYGRA